MNDWILKPSITIILFVLYGHMHYSLLPHLDLVQTLCLTRKQMTLSTITVHIQGSHLTQKICIIHDDMITACIAAASKETNTRVTDMHRT